LDVDRFDAFNVTQPTGRVGKRKVVLFVVTPQESTLENQPATGIDDRGAVSTTGREE
jgi:hypothetical protein